MDNVVILDEVVASYLAPIKAGGITLYPASALASVFAWADEAGHTVEWLEGVFFDRTSGAGQLSLDYMCERGADDGVFRERCAELAINIQTEAERLGMEGCFEIGITQSADGS